MVVCLHHQIFHTLNDNKHLEILVFIVMIYLRLENAIFWRLGYRKMNILAKHVLCVWHAQIKKSIQLMFKTNYRKYYIKLTTEFSSYLSVYSILTHSLLVCTLTSSSLSFDLFIFKSHSFITLNCNSSIWNWYDRNKNSELDKQRERERDIREEVRCDLHRVANRYDEIKNGT